MRLFLIVGFLTLALGGGLYIMANCSATATGIGCNASCTINNTPAGGSSTCTSSARRADCKAFDAAGNQCCATGCICTATFPQICYIQIGSTCC